MVDAWYALLRHPGLSVIKVQVLPLSDRQTWRYFSPPPQHPFHPAIIQSAFLNESKPKPTRMEKTAESTDFVHVSPLDEFQMSWSFLLSSPYPPITHIFESNTAETWSARGVNWVAVLTLFHWSWADTTRLQKKTTAAVSILPRFLRK